MLFRSVVSLKYDILADLSAKAMELNLGVGSPTKTKETRRSPEKRGRSGRPGGELPVLRPIPVSIAYDMRHVAISGKVDGQSVLNSDSRASGIFKQSLKSRRRLVMPELGFVFPWRRRFYRNI